MVREIQIGLLQDQRLYSDGQEPTINIDSEIDNKKSDDEMHQFIESIETENFVDDLSQAQQQQESIRRWKSNRSRTLCKTDSNYYHQ